MLFRVTTTVLHSELYVNDVERERFFKSSSITRPWSAETHVGIPRLVVPPLTGATLCRAEPDSCPQRLTSTYLEKPKDQVARAEAPVAEIDTAFDRVVRIVAPVTENNVALVAQLVS